jgi:hypothetical protein
MAKNPPSISRGQPGKWVRKKHSKAKSLLGSLDEHRQNTLDFLYDLSVPFK